VTNFSKTGIETNTEALLYDASKSAKQQQRNQMSKIKSSTPIHLRQTLSSQQKTRSASKSPSVADSNKKNIPQSKTKRTSYNERIG